MAVEEILTVHSSGVVEMAEQCDRVVKERKSRQRRPKIRSAGDTTKKVKLENEVKDERAEEFPTDSNAPPPEALSQLQNSEHFAVPKYGMASVWGSREYMEDAVSGHPSFCKIAGDSNGEFHFFAVYDGHGCSHVSTLCKERMHEIVKEEILGEEESENWVEIMKRSFMRMDNEANSVKPGHTIPNCKCRLQLPKRDGAGSTAVVAVVTPDQIIVANCGDSRAVLCRNGKPIFATIDHKPSRPDEVDRIEAAGGHVIPWDDCLRVSGILSMTRAIGDSYLKPYIISEPEVTVVDRTKANECLILASDGLWDRVPNEDACRLALHLLKKNSSSPCTPLDGDLPVADKGSDMACSNASTSLTKIAMSRGRCDNISVVVVDLRKPIISSSSYN